MGALVPWTSAFLCLTLGLAAETLGVRKSLNGENESGPAVIRLLQHVSLSAITAVLTTSPGAQGTSGAGPSGWHLVWHDEFDGDGVDTSKWICQIGTGPPEGPVDWGNGELEYYRQENAVIHDGALHIIAKREDYGGKAYTSARLRTKGKGDWTYGRIEFRAKLPTGQGLWPALWMMPTDSVYGSWAASGEIDVMEAKGHIPNQVSGTLHYGGSFPRNVHSGGSYVFPSGNYSDNFHTYALEWEPEEIRWYVDGAHYLTKTQWYTTGGESPAPFDQDFHILMNLAVGGNYLKPNNDPSQTRFPKELVIDYVRVYQRPRE
jgi:beta-glucanase (GH16 family)